MIARGYTVTAAATGSNGKDSLLTPPAMITLAEIFDPTTRREDYKQTHPPIIIGVSPLIFKKVTPRKR
jgi:hypothetical protein